jgi:hypothetical protein
MMTYKRSNARREEEDKRNRTKFAADICPEEEEQTPQLQLEDNLP